MPVTMEERKAFWKFVVLRKKSRAIHGRQWAEKLLDAVEKEEGIEARETMNKHLLRMHQIELRLWNEDQIKRAAELDKIKPE